LHQHQRFIVSLAKGGGKVREMRVENFREPHLRREGFPCNFSRGASAAHAGESSTEISKDWAQGDCGLQPADWTETGRLP
jgi:hypothetical protein